jgi:hypothetical protein
MSSYPMPAPSAPPAMPLPSAPPALPMMQPLTPLPVNEFTDLTNRMKGLGQRLTGDNKAADSRAPTPSILSFIGLTLVLGIVTYVIAEISNYREIRRNWPEYRCHPQIAPFAKFYGYDLQETMNFCIGESVKEHAPGVITPIYEGINKAVGVVEGVYDKAKVIEGGVVSLLSGFERFVLDFVNSFRLVGTRIRMSLVRIKDIFARVYGTFIAFAYAAISAITFGENLVCNPLVQFVGTIAGVDICCFAPNTRVFLDSGETAAISEVDIGTRLYGGPVVTARYLFDGRSTRMFRIHGIHISGNHYVRDPDTSDMIHAEEHPDAVSAESLPEIWCLATSNNWIPVERADGRVLMCADYEESYDPIVIAEAQKAAERVLNGAGWMAGPPVPDFSLGVDPAALVMLQDGSARPISDIRMGEILSNGARVVGLIREECATLVHLPQSGIVVSAAQLIFRSGHWQRAANVFAPAPARAAPQILCHLMLTGGEDQIIPIMDPQTRRTYLLRDYAEVEDDAVQAPYDRAMMH